MSEETEAVVWTPYLVAVLSAVGTAICLYVSDVIRSRSQNKNHANAALRLIASDVFRIVSCINDKYDRKQGTEGNFQIEVHDGVSKRVGSRSVPFPCFYFFLSGIGDPTFALVQRYVEVLLKDISLLPGELQPKIMSFYRNVESLSLSHQRHNKDTIYFKLSETLGSFDLYAEKIIKLVAINVELAKTGLKIAEEGCLLLNDIGNLGLRIERDLGANIEKLLETIHGKIRNVESDSWIRIGADHFEKSGGDFNAYINRLLKETEDN